MVHVDVPITGLPATLHGFSVAQISDIHVGPTIKSGYTVTLAAGANAAAGPLDCNGTATNMGYFATAMPNASGGVRAFATDAGGAIWQDSMGAILTQPFTRSTTVNTIQ